MDDLKELLESLSDKDWKERKEASLNISSSLNNIIDKVSMITHSLIENLISENIDERYWSGEILTRLSPDYFGRELLEFIKRNSSDRDILNNVRKIINTHMKWFEESLRELFFEGDDILKHRIIEITAFYPREEFRVIYENALMSKYVPCVKSAVDALSDISSLEKFLDYSFVLNTNNPALVTSFFEKIISIISREDLIFSDVIKAFSGNIRIEEKSEVIFYISSEHSSKQICEIISGSDYGILSLILILNRYLNIVSPEEIFGIQDDNVILVYIFLCIMNERYEDIAGNISLLTNDNILEFCISDRRIAGLINIQDVEKIYSGAENPELRFKILRNCKISQESSIVESIEKDFDELDKSGKIDVMRFIASYRDDHYIPFFIRNFRDTEWIVRKFAANSLIDFGNDAMIYLDEYIFSDNPDVSYWSYYCKIILSSEDNILFLKDVVRENKFFEIRKLALRRLCILNNPAASDIITHILENGDTDLKNTIYENCISNSCFNDILQKYPKN